MVESCLCHAATRYKGFCHGWGLKFTFETPIKNTVPAALLPRFLHAVAGGGHPLGDLAGADPLGMALGVRSFSVPRSSGLGGRQGEQGKNVPVGTEVPLGTKFKKTGTRFLLQPSHQKGPSMLGKLTCVCPPRVRPLKQREKSKTQPPVSLKKGPF